MMNSRRLNAWIRLLLIPCCVSTAGSAQVLTLGSAVDKAVNNYPLMQQRQAEIKAGRAHISTVSANKLPSLTLQEQLNMGTANSIQGSYFPMGLVPSGSGLSSVHNDPNPGNLAVSFLQWEFYNFGYYHAQKKEAEAQLAVSEANLGSDKYLLTESIISLYLDWQKKYRLLHVQQENMQRAQLVLNAIRANVLSGLKPGVDSATASAAYADARISYMQALDDYNDDLITMCTYTGAGNDVTPDTSFIAPALLQNTAQVQLMDTVPAGHPLLNVYEKMYEQQLAGNNSISRKYLPHLSVDGAAWERNSGISPSGVYPDDFSVGMPYNRFNYLVGLSFTYNIFDLKHRHDQLAEGRYYADAMQSRLQTQRLTLSRMIRQANARYLTTQEKLRELPAQLTSARQAYGQQLALYRSGLNTLLDVTNAQYALLQAETLWVVTQSDLLQLLYLRAGLNGQLDIFLQNFKR